MTSNPNTLWKKTYRREKEMNFIDLIGSKDSPSHSTKNKGMAVKHSQLLERVSNEVLIKLLKKVYVRDFKDMI